MDVFIDEMLFQTTLPPDLVKIIATYLCDACETIRTRVHELAYCNLLMAEITRYKEPTSSLRFSHQNHTYFMETCPPPGTEPSERIRIDIDSLTAVIAHGLPLNTSDTKFQFPSAKVLENHHYVRGDVEYSTLWTTRIMDLICYQVTRCPEIRKRICDGGNDRYLSDLISMSNTSSNASSTWGEVYRLPDGNYPPLDNAQPLCPPNCPHRVKLDTQADDTDNGGQCSS